MRAKGKGVTGKRQQPPPDESKNKILEGLPQLGRSELNPFVEWRDDGEADRDLQFPDGVAKSDVE